MEKLELIKYGHNYCQPCKFVEPILQKVADENKEKVSYKAYDTYQMTPEELTSASLKAVPTIIIRKNGEEVWRHVGVIDKEALTNKIKEF